MNKTNHQKTLKKRTDILIRLALILVVLTILFFFVVKPMLNKDFYFDSGEDYTFNNLGSVSGEDSFDVVVVGDGIDAVTGALGSAKVGAKTLLVCKNRELGEDIRKTYNVSWAQDVTPTGNSVSSDMFKEIRYKSGEGSNVENYIKTIEKMVSEQKKLEVAYNAQLMDITPGNGRIDGIKLRIGQEDRNISSERFIDATADGQLLKKSRVGFTTGYADIGLNGLYPPVKLNFMVSGVNYEELEELVQKQATLLDLIIKSYKTGDRNISVSGFNITDQGNSSVVIEGITMNNVNTSDKEELRKAYEKANKECMNFYNYLKLNVEQFKNASGASVAQEFITPSPYHFKGRYLMTLSDVLTGKRYTDRISSASRPVTLIMEDNSRYLLCNPKTFYIPLSSVIPENLNNVLMTGDKISASSLVQTAISSNSSKAGTGFAAGIIAAYSISKEMDIPQIVDDHNLDTQQEIEKVLRKMGIYMSDIKEDISSITGDWSYPYMEKLNNMGLLSGGITNDYKYDKEAESKDLAYIILNGVTRISENTYNLDFDFKVRKYLKNEPLTKELFGQILLEVAGKTGTQGNYYSEACKQGLIDDTLQSELKNKKVLQFSEVYYASVKLFERLTGKAMK